MQQQILTVPIARHERLLSFSRHTTSSSINTFQKYFNRVQHLISALFNIYMFVYALFRCFEKDFKNMLLKKDKFIIKSNDRQYSQPRSLNLFSQQEKTQIGRFDNYLLHVMLVFFEEIYAAPKYTRAIQTLIYFTYPKVTATQILNMYTIDDIKKETKVRLLMKPCVNPEKHTTSISLSNPVKPVHVNERQHQRSDQGNAHKKVKNEIIYLLITKNI
ncbi:hypothetical protein RFI_21976 [Reticulomyxa filosa]|uniref:Transmembrane protein n=1 Tax=Reticulomyxa filosa TaxID=46433 RepID=X6MN46_RETFI|nr:hypothetical protein RFI_21976 [Reticulomyxa filosa]|eukprot:ETO15388.1 hypothetical protein RFI_21976 [Reticulomyxa filosa]